MMTIRGLGLDLIDLAHFAVHYGDIDEELLARCFTGQEIADAGLGAARLARLASRFAVKEATFKALGGGARVSHLDIETVSSGDGPPAIKLSGAASEMANAQDIGTFLVSISHSATSAGAVVIAVTGPRY